MQRGYSLLILFILFVDHSVIGTCSILAVTAVLGETITLPCLISGYNERAGKKTKRIYWQTSNDTPKPVEAVHVYNDGKEEFQDQSEKYKQRTKLFLDQLKNGNFSIQLISIKVSDEDVYECYYQQENNMRLVCSIDLQVSAHYNDPVLSRFQIDNDTTQFTCISKEGYPAPKVHWSFSDSESFTDHTLENSAIQDNLTGLYSVVSNLTVRTNQSISVTCVIENERIQENKSAAIYKKVYTSPDNQGPDAPPTHVTVVVVLMVILLVIASVVIRLLYKRRLPFQTSRQNPNRNSNCTYKKTNNDDTAEV
ncbi:ICOS ligand-like [Protopterus annectens]|uniref:ICOS ligand-like n=1 Tax=Protopterus annectens TaxID=7888 RepID=UPI001CF97F6E|nr:ICOS ligand-like [Protopterus annectens]XP_043928440.1 ICOS ligand-like [Protopterus annectens]XP_043928441.1 ICOS ligand-like [Protopterus annectens]XP_043928442.1 ICOS ligand-like [Protopterus annectens]